MLNKFLWLHKQPRISFALLCQHKQQNGLNYQDLSSYYKTTLLSKVIKARRGSRTLYWVNTLLLLIHPRSIQEAFWRDSHSCNSNMFLSAMLKSWDSTRSILCWPISRFPSIFFQQWFTPGAVVLYQRLGEWLEYTD